MIKKTTLALASIMALVSAPQVQAETSDGAGFLCRKAEELKKLVIKRGDVAFNNFILGVKDVKGTDDQILFKLSYTIVNRSKKRINSYFQLYGLAKASDEYIVNMALNSSPILGVAAGTTETVKTTVLVNKKSSKQTKQVCWRADITS